MQFLFLAPNRGVVVQRVRQGREVRQDFRKLLPLTLQKRGKGQPLCFRQIRDHRRVPAGAGQDRQLVVFQGPGDREELELFHGSLGILSRYAKQKNQ